jgi:glycosyltransferase involved in cell wall biosynthesis
MRKLLIPVVLLENRVAPDFALGSEVIHLSPRLHGDTRKLSALLSEAWLLRRFVRKRGIDTVLSFLERSNYVNVLARLLGSQHRVIISERTTPSVNYSGRQLRNLVAKSLIRILYRRADAIIAVSDGVKYDLVEGFGLPDEKVHVIYNPVDLERIQRQAAEVPQMPWYREGVPIIVTTGRLEEPKGHCHLLRAFAILRTRMQCRLVLIGEGSLRAELELLVRRLGLEADVWFAGWQANPYQYMAHSTVFVLSSLWEGFPGALLEALACGLPVVSFDCQSGPREILRNGECGILVPVGDEECLAAELVTLLGTPARCQDLSRRARERALQFEVTGALGSYWDVLKVSP